MNITPAIPDTNTISDTMNITPAIPDTQTQSVTL